MERQFVSVYSIGANFILLPYYLALSLGAEAVWVGTRFVASKEAQTTKLHQKYLLQANTDQTMRSVVFTGRPARVYETEYIQEWEHERKEAKL